MKKKNWYVTVIDARLGRRLAVVMFTLAILLTLSGLYGSRMFAESAADGFTPNVDGPVFTAVVQSSGKIVIGGAFSSVNGVARDNLARLNPDGTLDTTFTAGTNGGVNALLMQADGKLVLGGIFTTLNGQPRNRLGRITAAGALDAAFDPDANGFVEALAQQADGQLLVGGNFTTLGGLAALRVARLSQTGALDTGFIATVNDGTVSSLAIEPDGQVLLGGTFTSVNGVARNRVARVQFNGNLDTNFNPNANGKVASMAVLPGGQIMLGGSFTTISGQTHNRLAKLNADGSLDASFTASVNNSVATLALQPNGELLVGGDYTQINGLPRNRLARFHVDGTLDSNFAALINDVVYAIAVQPDGNVVIGGGFTAVTLQTRNHLARLYAYDAKVDNDLNLAVDGPVLAMAAQPDGKLIIGGDFTTVGGQTRSRLARLNTDGSLDSGFNLGAAGPVYALALQPDGKVLVGGVFLGIGGGIHPGIARLNADGSLDTSFVATTTDQVYAIAVQADGKILMGGAFTEVSNTLRNRLARLNPDGTLEASFNAGINNTVRTLAVQPDGKIVIGGEFTNISGQGRSFIARLNSNSSVDTSFNPGANGQVFALALQGNGDILAGGAFTTLGGQTRNRIGRINGDGTLDTGFNPGANDWVTSFATQMNGQILVGGYFSQLAGQTRNRLARLGTNGVLDTGFNPGAGGLYVSGMVVMMDGKIVVGGELNQLAGLTRTNLGRLDTEEGAWQKLSVNDAGTAINWSFVGAAPEFSRVEFELSSNGVDFAPLAAASRVSGGWELTGLSLTQGQRFFVRARGTYATGHRNGSASIAEAVRAVYLIPCTFSVSPNAFSPSIAGGTFNLTVTAANQSCAWTAQSNVPWITVSASGSGSKIISYTVAANPGVLRTGTMTIAGQTVTIAQSGVGGCVAVTLSPTNAVLPVGQAGQFYSQTFTQTGGQGQINWTISAGALPNGLTLNASSGVLSGTPTVFGDFNFTVKATDANNCIGTRAYSLHLNTTCAAVTVNPATLPNGFAGTSYAQTITASGGSAPYSYTVSGGSFPTGLTLVTSGVISGQPSASGVYNFTLKATDANGCFGTRSYTVVMSGAGLMYYALPKPIRLFDTRSAISGFDACAYLNQPLMAGQEQAFLARLTCAGVTIPANAKAIVGNATIINAAAVGYATLWPDEQPRPPVSSLNYSAGQTVPNAFTVGLSAAGKFNVYSVANAQMTVDITGYFAPPAAQGLFYHPLPHPIRLYDTRAAIPGFNACEYMNQKLAANGEMSKLARVSCDGVTIPNDAVAIVGNATIINPNGLGFATLWPEGQARPPVANLNYVNGQIIANAFTVGLGASGQFKVYSVAQTDLVVDVTGYYSTSLEDVNGAGLLYESLAHPIRLYDTRAPIAGFNACEYLNQPIAADGELAKQARVSCDGVTVPTDAQAITGNAIAIGPSSVGFATLWPNGPVRPPVANLNYGPGQVVANAFTVALGANGQFRVYSFAQTHFVADVTGYYAP